MKRSTLSAATVAMIACPAFGTITVGVGVTTDGGKVANAVNITATGPWFGANLFVDVTQGSVINLDPGLGGVDTAPSQAEINTNPALLFDTYVGRVGAATNLMGGAVLLGGTDPYNMGPTRVDASWHVGINSAVPLTHESITNLVFSGDAAGTWSLGVVEAGNAQVKYTGGTLSGGKLVTDFVVGDVDVDNFTGIDDLNYVLSGWNTGTQQGPWSYSPTGVAGDLNGDEFAGIDDLNILLGSWHEDIPPGDPAADPSGDGFVGLDDLSIVLNYWHNGTPPIVVVPEPIGLGLISLGALALLRKRQA